MRSVLLLVLALLLTESAAAQTLGETDFPTSGAPEAQEPFLRGLLLLHSFEYDDAREAFQQARQIDPDFAMAAWGEAMTHNHPVWMRQDLDAARAALEGVDTSGATAREQAYLATLAVLYGDGDKEARDDAYAEAMQGLAEAYPDDLDARAFYALSILGTAHEGRDFTTYMKAAAVAEEVFDENPRHPGAAHYLIHAYDDPVHAPLGLRPARVYADVAPAASHALHMPSHIYLALGLWEDVAAMNERSFEAAKANTDRRGLPLNGHGWHALWWWHYAATQLGDTAEARRLHDLAVELAGAEPDGSALAHLTRIRAQHAAATGETDVLALDAPASNAFDGLANGLALAARGDLAASRAVLADLQALSEGHDEPRWSDQAAALELEATLLLADGDGAAAEARLREATALEDAAPLTFGPPAPVVPTHEMLGRVLLDLGRPAEAAVEFEAALARAPGRRQSVEGLAEAQAALEAAGTR